MNIDLKTFCKTSENRQAPAIILGMGYGRRWQYSSSQFKQCMKLTNISIQLLQKPAKNCRKSQGNLGKQAWTRRRGKGDKETKETRRQGRHGDGDKGDGDKGDEGDEGDKGDKGDMEQETRETKETMEEGGDKKAPGWGLQFGVIL
ncbi:MAG: hypothetical protein JNK20_15390 [Flavipsychrobacter sp.]|nr:hypothetical protein [Flavipsychrobacter sp.]